MQTWPFGDLKPFRYDLICIDPPVRHEAYSDKGLKKSPQAQYPTLTHDEIKALPVGDLATPDAICLCWSRAPNIPDTLEYLKAWGFKFKTELVWHKITASGKTRTGPGYRARSQHEPAYLAAKGRTEIVIEEEHISIILGGIGGQLHQPFPSHFSGIAREHSRKPEEFYALVDRCFPTAWRRCDLFARQRRPGWEVWGNEVDKFDPEVAA